MCILILNRCLYIEAEKTRCGSDAILLLEILANSLVVLSFGRSALTAGGRSFSVDRRSVGGSGSEQGFEGNLERL